MLNLHLVNHNYVTHYSIGIARGGHGRAREFALLSLNFALPSKPSSYLNCSYVYRGSFITYLES